MIVDELNQFKKTKWQFISKTTYTKYFEIALDNIRNIKVSDERKVSRVKRLLLRANFNKWNVADVSEDY